MPQTRLLSFEFITLCMVTFLSLCNVAVFLAVLSVFAGSSSAQDSVIVGEIINVNYNYLEEFCGQI